jgi:TetR/AcrR family transcriptional repressor of bet genes
VPRRRDDDAQRARLSEAVFTTLAERGPSGFTLRAVAETAGCTTGLVLHTFADRRALLLHARDVLHARTRERSDDLERRAPDAASAVRAIVLEALPSSPATLAEARVWTGFLAASLSDPVLAARQATDSSAFADRLGRLLQAVSDSSDDDARARASALAAMVEGVSSLAAGDPDGWPADRQRAAVSVVLDAALGGPQGR